MNKQNKKIMLTKICIIYLLLWDSNILFVRYDKSASRISCPEIQ